jgi:hypothetical protein
MDQGNGEIARSSQNLRSISATQTRTIFSKGHIAHIMRAVFNRPVPTNDGKETRRRSLRSNYNGVQYVKNCFTT